MRFILVAMLFSLPGFLNAETVFITATQDNTLYEDQEGALSNGKGEFLFVGRNDKEQSRNALVAFKDLSAIPADAVIQSVKLHLHVSEASGSLAEVYLLSVLEDWGEGASDAPGQEHMGAPAAPGDATWIHSFYDSETWLYPGGVFAWWPSDLSYIMTARTYTFGPQPEMITNVQTWLLYPEENFGWILVADQEFDSLVRIHSRENAVSPPVLEVTYSSTGSANDYSGVWHDPDRDGEGYSVIQTPLGWIVYFFGYSSAGEFLWLTSDLVKLDEFEHGVSYELPMLIGVPGTFTEPSPASMLQSYGSLEIMFEDCTGGVFRLDGPDGFKVSNVVKLVGVDNTSCGASQP